MQRQRLLLFAAAIAAASVVPLTMSAADWKTPRTPWGDPDLQGVWSTAAEMSTPFERPASFGTRQWLTDEEFEQRLKQVTTPAGYSPARRRTRRRIGSSATMPRGTRRSSSTRLTAACRRYQPRDGSVRPRAPRHSATGRSMGPKMRRSGCAASRAAACRASCSPPCTTPTRASCRDPGTWRSPTR